MLIGLFRKSLLSAIRLLLRRESKVLVFYLKKKVVLFQILYEIN